jgi:histidinol-phosphate phosphatase family protein
VNQVDLLHRAEDLEVFPFSSSALKKINDSDYLAILCTNQPVVARNLCTLEELRSIHNRLETLLGRDHAFLNDIYFCPHHPDRGYPGENAGFKIDCDCRKPQTGMIKMAVEEYNVDIESSWFIGDATMDIQTGVNAGLKTILVRTGKGGKDGRYPCSPDYEFDDLESAVEFILNQKAKYVSYV